MLRPGIAAGLDRQQLRTPHLSPPASTTPGASSAITASRRQPIRRASATAVAPPSAKTWPTCRRMQHLLRHTDQMHCQHFGQRNIFHLRQADVKNHARFCLQSSDHSCRKRRKPRSRQKRHQPPVHPAKKTPAHPVAPGRPRTSAWLRSRCRRRTVPCPAALRLWAMGAAGFNSAPKNSAPPAISHRSFRRAAQLRTSSALATSPMTIPRSGKASPSLPTEIGSADGLSSSSSTFGRQARMLRVAGKLRLVNQLAAHEVLTIHHRPSERGIGRHQQRAGQAELPDDGFDLRRHVAAQNGVGLLVNPFRAAALQQARGAWRRVARLRAGSQERESVSTTDEVRVAARFARENDLGPQTMPQSHGADFRRAGQIVCDDADHFLIIPLENVAWLICLPEGSQHVAVPSHMKFRQVETDFFWPLDQNWVQTALPSGR